jgi:TolB-like protein/DNA-binding winged helix-turn-helix (wHTH) protein
MDEMNRGPGPFAASGVTGYRIDDLLVDLGQQRVTRDAVEIKLPGLSFDLLVALARAAPNIVTVAALMDDIWAGLVVSPETVSQRVKLLRSALGDDAGNARYIAGVRGRGYRLVAMVTPLTSATAVVGGPESEPASAALPETSPKTAGRFVGRGVAFGLAIGLGLAIWATLGGQSPHVAPMPRRAPTANEHLPPGSVAVLPFGSLTGDPAMRDLGLAMAAAIHHRLAVQRDLLVVARGSSFAIGSAGDAREIGRRLGARYLVEGTVQRSDRQLRVTAELVDAFTGTNIRGLRFDRTINDVLAVQDEIADRVAAALEVTVQATTVDYATYGQEAYLAYIRGSALLSTRKFNDADAAVKELSRAIELAPRFASAYPALALAKFQSVFVRNEYNPETAKVLWPEFDTLIARALELDPNNGEAYFMRGKYKSTYLRDIEGAEEDYRKGMALNPNYAPGLEDFAEFLWGFKDETAESLAILDRARRVDPLSPRGPYIAGNLLWTVRGDLPEAAAMFHRIIEIAPDFYPAYLRLAQLEWNQGRLAEGIRLAEKGLELEPGVVWGRMYLFYFYVDMGDLLAARDVLSGMASPDLSAEALICMRVGKLETAEQLLRRAVREGTFDVSSISDGTVLDGVVARALQVHRYAAAIRLIQPAIADAEHPEKLVYDLDHLDGLVLRAAADKAAGHAEASHVLVQKMFEVLDKKSIAWYPGRADLMRAMAFAVVDRNDDALSALGRAQTTAARIGWWDIYGEHPAFASLHGLPQFQAFTAEVHEWAERERAALEAARAAHAVPARRGAAVSRFGC